MSPKPSPFDVHQVHEVTILVTTAASSLDSSSSTSTGSPTLPIPESPLHDARSSVGSSHGTPTVKFAPLPQVDPNRKRSLAPLGVPARLRRKQAIQQEGGSLLWSADLDVSEEDMEDPIISFAKFVKKTSKTLWQRMRKGSRTVRRESVASSYSCDEPVLDIGPAVHWGGENASKAVDSGDKQGRRASWSPLAERRTLSLDETQRRSTSDLPQLSLVP